MHFLGVNILVGDTIKDLVVLVNEDLKMDQQCTLDSKKANRLLGCIKKALHQHLRILFKPLCRALVSPHIEYDEQFWSQYFKKDIGLLEKIPHRATK